LFCLWCAQDIEANHFWESIGFLPLAFRSGSRGKKRMHIFWQRRIREGDTTTPYWFPSLSKSGAIREDRLVLPIPPGVHWKDVMPVIQPGERGDALKDGRKALPEPKERKRAAAPSTGCIISGGAIQFAKPGAATSAAKPKRAAGTPRKPAAKHDPSHVAAARELRDRYLEQLNAGLVLPDAKYDVSRAVPQGRAEATSAGYGLGVRKSGTATGLLPPRIDSSDSGRMLVHVTAS
jgi:hypothetical protein